MTKEQLRKLRPRGVSWQGLLARYAVPGFLVISCVLFSILRPDSFGTVDNFRSILNTNAIVVIIAFAAMLPFMVGEFDLSPPYNVSFTLVIVIGLITRSDVRPYQAIAVCLVIAAAVGLFQGLVIAFLHVRSFVVTLGTTSLLIAGWTWYLGNETIIAPQPEYFNSLARGSVAGVPLPVIYMVIVALVLWFVLTQLPAGRRLIAIGANRDAAHLSGIRTRRYVIGAFTLGGLLAGIAGVVLAARLGSASGGVAVSLLFPAYTAVFLGATTIHPGRFNVPGTVVSVYMLATLVSGLQHLGAEPWVEPAFNGLALVAAGVLSAWAFRARARQARREQLARLAAEKESALDALSRKGDAHDPPLGGLDQPIGGPTRQDAGHSKEGRLSSSP